MQGMEKRKPGIKGKVVTEQPMKELISLKTGGLADFFVIPEDIDDLKVILDFCTQEKTPFLVIGNGSKLLIRDEGFRGIVVKLGKELRKIKNENKELIIGAGTNLSSLIDFTTNKGLSGLESLAGIPGTLGGAVVRNASAFGESLSQRIIWAKVLDRNNSGFTLPRKDMDFGYRTSIFLKNKDLVLVEVKLSLCFDSKEKIISRLKETNRKKIQTQPLSFPSAGCVFKNPSFYSAGYLIQSTGCLGMRVGDAQISFQHGNFIINRGQAQAKDIIQLMEKVRERVKGKFNILLEPEIEII
ncbi:UDP-N-acetylmuramate dehydrogenase [Patescibacteria group bacterium]|nr:UDP-N-acetylmuramate dehydrogenase [Patescibacteria group bacterium]